MLIQNCIFHLSSPPCSFLVCRAFKSFSGKDQGKEERIWKRENQFFWQHPYYFKVRGAHHVHTIKDKSLPPSPNTGLLVFRMSGKSMLIKSLCYNKQAVSKASVGHCGGWCFPNQSFLHSSQNGSGEQNKQRRESIAEAAKSGLGISQLLTTSLWRWPIVHITPHMLEGKGKHYF